MASTDIFYTTREKLTQLYDAIRAKSGRTGAMTIDEAIAATQGIVTGDNLPTVLTGGSTTLELVYPDITRIMEYAFRNVKLRSISCAAVTQMGSAVFQCDNADTSMTDINFPELTQIGWNCFQMRAGLTRVSLPKLVTVSNSAFKGCTGLVEVDLGTAWSFQANAFNGCSNLTTLINRSTLQANLADTTCFAGTPIADLTGAIYVPDNLVDTYKAATNWTTYASIIKPLSEYTGGTT